MPIRIEAADDPRISDYVGLRDRRESDDEFLIAETKQVIERLMKSRLKIRSMLFSTKAHAKLVGSSRVDLQACKLEYSIVSPK